METTRCQSSGQQQSSLKTGISRLCLLILTCFLTITLQAEDGVNTSEFDRGKAAYLEKDYKTAYEILYPLAEEGNSQAQVTIGIMYDYGQGVDANATEAFKWYKLAAEQGIPIVQHDLGVKYFQGIGTKQDYLQAAKWWELSSNAGLPDSQFNLGLMHYRGIGLQQDFDQARTLFNNAASQGHGHAQYSLAVMYAFGQGIEKDYDIALDWFLKAADQNIAQAQYNLGVLYENGYGVDKNLETARNWYQLAADQNLAEAREKLANLNSTDVAIEVIESPEITEAIDSTAVQETVEPIRHPDMAKAPGIAAGEDWVNRQSADTYTIQIGSGIDEKDIINFLRENRLQDAGTYIKVLVKGTTRYSALYGSFESFAEAKAAISSLPNHIQATKPWVRNFGVLQKLLLKSEG